MEPDTSVYNANVLNSNARMATVINARIIDRVKAFKLPAIEAGIDGVKFTAEIAYRNFVNESINHADQLEIYLPIELIVKFGDADITSQQLVDGGVVLLNGNRVQVSLTGG